MIMATQLCTPVDAGIHALAHSLATYRIEDEVTVRVGHHVAEGGEEQPAEEVAAQEQGQHILPLQFHLRDWKETTFMDYQ